MRQDGAKRSEAPKRQRSPQHADPKRSEGTRPKNKINPYLAIPTVTILQALHPYCSNISIHLINVLPVVIISSTKRILLSLIFWGSNEVKILLLDKEIKR
ncbi:MAG: hypothetical protein NZ455_05480 [Bacteroidia bacterium]|nr:hypothetical protein [Bacteroidia bacterium]